MKNFKHFKTLMSDDGGNVMIMVAAFLATTIAIGGAAIDFGRAQLLQMKQQQAADNASLAAGNILNRNYNESDNAAIREATARLYYNLNVPATYLGVDRSTPTVQYSTVNRSVVVTSTGQIKTNYTGVNGGNEYVNVASATRVLVPQDNTPDFDAVLVVDLSASTGLKPWPLQPTKTIMAAEKEAITTMVNAIFPENQAVNPNVRFGLIGYSGPIVNASSLTSDRNTALTYITPLKSWHQNFDQWGLEAAMKMLTADWDGFVAPRHCRDGIGKELGYNAAAVKKDGCVIDWTRTRSVGNCQLSSQGICWYPEIDSGGNRCYTYSPYMPDCLPERNTEVSAPVTDRTDDRELSQNRYIVFISDGAIMRDPGADSPASKRKGCRDDWNYYWRKAYPTLPDIDTAYIQSGDVCNTSGGTVPSGSNYQAFLRQCDAIKNAGITIYTINFVQPAGADYDTMRACASSESKSFYAPTQTELQNILSGIALQINNIRIKD